MKIGIVTIAADLKTALLTTIQQSGEQAEEYQQPSQAVKAGAALIFVQWTAEVRRGVLAILERRAVTARPAVIALVSPGDVSAMRQARDDGATGVLFTPPDFVEIRAELEAAKKALDSLGSKPNSKLEVVRQTLLGEAPNFIRCLQDLELAAQSDVNVLMLGETGTGKEMFARAIHVLSSRAPQPFFPVNCVAVPEGLLEGTMFGHARGSFTGAEREHAGWLEAVGDGTLLLDEIGAVNLAVQTKLLRALDQRVFKRVGDNRDIPFRGRLISATSVDINQAVLRGHFRRDLLGRIEQFRITLPPLRERREDIPLLVQHFIGKHGRGRRVEFSGSSMDVLKNLTYPGNIRQLENAVVASLARVGAGDIVLPRHLPIELLDSSKGDSAEDSRATIEVLFDRPYSDAREAALEAVDRLYLGRLLEQSGGSLSAAAQAAGLDRKTLAARMARSGLAPTRDNETPTRRS